MELTLRRTQTGDQGTFGRLCAGGRPLCFTGEPPWRDNAPNRSCIPAGTYDLEPWSSRRFPGTFHLREVPGRAAILIHQGNLCGDRKKNYLAHTLGCIIIGQERGRIRGQEAVLLSGVALRELRALLGRERHVLTVSPL